LPSTQLVCRPQEFHTWTLALTTMIRDYYETSYLRVPDGMEVSVLLALECLGILYRPDQMIFASLWAYRLVQDWSDYLARRSEMADWYV
jgi:hypothetical protein